MVRELLTARVGKVQSPRDGIKARLGAVGFNTLHWTAVEPCMQNLTLLTNECDESVGDDP